MPNLWISGGPSSATAKAGQLTVAVKDIFCTVGDTTTCASKMLATYRSPVESTVTRLLKEAPSKYSIVGKVNMDEFGMGSINRHSYFGALSNPHSDLHVAGGSSGGSAYAVASGQADVALSSDTGGSTRLPAAYCGVVGFKPSYGLVSRWGMASYASSLDTVGIIARDIDKCRDVFNTISMYDSKDPSSVPDKYRLRANHTPYSLKGKRIGVPHEYFQDELRDCENSVVLDAVQKLIDAAESLGASVEMISLPHVRHSMAAYYVIASAEAASNLSRFDGVRYGYKSLQDTQQFFDDNANRTQTRTEAFGDEVASRILMGTYVSSSALYDRYLRKAQCIRRLVQEDFTNVFKNRNANVDFIMAPVSVSTAPRMNSQESVDNEYVNDILTTPASLAGLPAISLPVHQSVEGLPVGVQLIAPYLQDDDLLSASDLLLQPLRKA